MTMGERSFVLCFYQVRRRLVGTFAVWCVWGCMVMGVTVSQGLGVRIVVTQVCWCEYLIGTVNHQAWFFVLCLFPSLCIFCKLTACPSCKRVSWETVVCVSCTSVMLPPSWASIQILFSSSLHVRSTIVLKFQLNLSCLYNVILSAVCLCH